jgi:hypothetical protein
MAAYDFFLRGIFVKRLLPQKNPIKIYGASTYVSVARATHLKKKKKK